MASATPCDQTWSGHGNMGRYPQEGRDGLLKNPALEEDRNRSTDLGQGDENPDLSRSVQSL